MRSDRWEQLSPSPNWHPMASSGPSMSQLVPPMGPSSTNFGRSARPFDFAVEALAGDADGRLQHVTIAVKSSNKLWIVVGGSS